jgi:SAM-dependent methyltransferase
LNDSNRIIVEAWNTVLYTKSCRFKHLLVDGLSQHTDAALERCRYSQGARVLDVGCGFGDSTLRIARSVGPSGKAIGVDCAENFIRAAEAEARKEKVDSAHFFVGDAQGGDLRAGEEGEKRKPQVVAALKEALAPFTRPDGIWAPSSTWFISDLPPLALPASG